MTVPPPLLQPAIAPRTIQPTPPTNPPAKNHAATSLKDEQVQPTNLGLLPAVECPSVEAGRGSSAIGAAPLHPPNIGKQAALILENPTF